MTSTILATEPLDADDPAPQIARLLLDGFDRHYRLFTETNRAAKTRFERADWAGQQRAQRERIDYYDQRVAEAVVRLRREFDLVRLDMGTWHRVKRHYIGLLVEHLQPELAETFFNSVTTRVLHRSYFNNDFIFLRPAISTEYIENDEPAATPTYRAYYPQARDLAGTIERIVHNFRFERPFEDLDRDVRWVQGAFERYFGMQAGDWQARANYQLQVLSSAFYRNKGAYIIGRIINGFRETGFAIPVLRSESGSLYLDTVLFGEDELARLFSFARAYFMVEMPVPSAYVQFLHALMPRKPRSEIYSELGLHKQGKNLFYRDFLHHLRHSGDRFRVSPGIKGMVMLVFDLPSFPYVFKVIRDRFGPQKETTPEEVRGKYLLVKQHDRVGRMADTLEYSKVAFPRERFDDELAAELQAQCASQLEADGSDLVIGHLYIERRLVPLNIYLQDALALGAMDRVEHAVIEYGHAIKDLVAANIFPGDMLWKNFGVTRHERVVFYDYDEIDYLTDCHFRSVPTPRTEEDELSGEVWYAVGPKDVFPETFGSFLLGQPDVRRIFMKHHAELLDPAFWQKHRDRIAGGAVMDVFPYDASRRFPAHGDPGNRCSEWPELDAR